SDLLIGSPYLSTYSQAGEAYVIFGEAPDGDTGKSATYKSFAKAGVAPRKGIGVVEDGSNDSFPASRLLLEFTSGESVSLQTVTIHREKPNSSVTLPNPASVYWQIITNRTPASGTVTVRFLEEEIMGLFKNELNLYTAESLAGPWTQVTAFADSNLNPGFGQKTLTAELSNLNTFLTVGIATPPRPIDSDRWLFLGE
ncbi:MAG: hypothetical protein SFY68_02345, partial [Candidatus Sumerlaeia bacterium]|nr:hypothetical protein [Candidatus Sumerlaeia bacterium]